MKSLFDGDPNFKPQKGVFTAGGKVYMDGYYVGSISDIKYKVEVEKIEVPLIGTNKVAYAAGEETTSIMIGGNEHLLTPDEAKQIGGALNDNMPF